MCDQNNPINKLHEIHFLKFAANRSLEFLFMLNGSVIEENHNYRLK